MHILFERVTDLQDSGAYSILLFEYMKLEHMLLTVLRCSNMDQFRVLCLLTAMTDTCLAC